MKNKNTLNPTLHYASTVFFTIPLQGLKNIRGNLCYSCTKSNDGTLLNDAIQKQSQYLFTDYTSFTNGNITICSESYACKITVTEYAYTGDVASVLVHFIKGDQDVMLVMKLIFMYCGRSGQNGMSSTYEMLSTWELVKYFLYYIYKLKHTKKNTGKNFHFVTCI